MSQQSDEEAMITSIFNALGPDVTVIQWADDDGTIVSEVRRPESNA